MKSVQSGDFSGELPCLPYRFRPESLVAAESRSYKAFPCSDCSKTPRWTFAKKTHPYMLHGNFPHRFHPESLVAAESRSYKAFPCSVCSKPHDAPLRRRPIRICCTAISHKGCLPGIPEKELQCFSPKRRRLNQPAVSTAVPGSPLRSARIQ